MKLNQPKDLYDLIQEVIDDRIYKFNYEQIDAIIKKRMELLEIDGYHTMYYHNSLLAILKHLEDKRILIQRDGFYIPVDTMIREEYRVDSTLLAYSTGFVRDRDYYMDDVEELFDVRTCDAISRIRIEIIKPVVLTGYLVGEGDYQQPEVSLEEIHYLYHKFINQGATVEEAIQYILNYYNAISLSDRFSNEKYPNRYKITPKIKKRFFWN